MSGFITRLVDAVFGRRTRTAARPAEEAASHATAPAAPVDPPPPVPAPDPVAAAAAQAFASSVRHLPMFSGTAVELIRSIGRDDTSGKELSRLISADAGLVAHLLRIVNSPFYGFPKRVATVGDTLAVLGVNQVRRIVTASVLQRPVAVDAADLPALHALRHHELACAALARHVASKRGLDGEAAYMGGLIHDVGRLAMLIGLPGYGASLARMRSDDGAAVAAERDRFGFDHAMAGGALLRTWGLPDAIVETVLSHERPDEPRDPLAACIWLANRASHALGARTEAIGAAEPWMRHVDLSPRELTALLEELVALESAAR